MKRPVGRALRGLLAAAMLAACIGAQGAATASAAAPDCAGRGVPDSKISIQLWTFAEYIGFGTDAATIERTREVFERLSDMGYRNVEPFTLSGLSAEEYRALLDEYGLKASARHVDIGTPETPADIDQILADNKTLGIKYFGSGSTPIFLSPERTTPPRSSGSRTPSTSMRSVRRRARRASGSSSTTTTSSSCRRSATRRSTTS